MHELVEHAVAAHGGWQRWREARALDAEVSIAGSVWPLKGWPGVFANARVLLDPHRQHVEYAPFVEPVLRSIYEPSRTAIVTDSGAVVGQREQLRPSFEGHRLPTPWDAQQLIYFSGYAMWTYLCTPFLFGLPGFSFSEGPAWQEDGEVWRCLRVSFPPDVHSHSREQAFYFDASGLLRRHDYSVDIMGGTSSANYASGHREFGGLIFPTRRRVYAIDADGHPLRDRVAVAIDVHHIDVRA